MTTQEELSKLEAEKKRSKQKARKRTARMAELRRMAELERLAHIGKIIEQYALGGNHVTDINALSIYVQKYRQQIAETQGLSWN